MVNRVGIAVRTAFIANRLAQHLVGSPQHDPVSSEMATLLQSDPLTAIIQAYCQSMGTTSNDKANIFAFKRLLAESGVRHTVTDDIIHIICSECQTGIFSGEIEKELRSYAETCTDPYKCTADSIALLGLNLDCIRERFRCLEMEKERLALEKAIEISLEKKHRILEKAKETVRHHYATLARKKRQLIIWDDYGVPDRRRWNDELRHFVTNVIGPSLDAEDLSDLSIEAILAYIEEVATETEPLHEDKSPRETTSGLSPRDFELHCSTVLQRQGWNTKLTAITGDQGIDIVADRNGLKLVFQCKQYSSPVGNKAVQEAHAGKDFLKADIAVVVSNANFTPSAKELAASLNVLLLHHTQLDEFDKVLFLNAQRRQQK